MSPLNLILIILVVLLLLGGWPAWGFHSYGYAPSGLGVVLLVVLIVLLVRGR